MSAGNATARLISAVEAVTGQQARKQGREYVVLCPVHSDHTPSGNIREGDGGWPIWVCRSHGCTMEQLLDVVGLAWGDVLGTEDDRWTPRGPYTAVYDYVDEQGQLLYQVCRTANKEFPQRTPNADKPKGWDWSLNGVRRVPFRLPRVIATAKAHEEVWLVEGEKDVLALEREGRTASCSPGGAGKWRDEYAVFFQSAHVKLVADLDPPGMRHAKAVFWSLATVAESVSLYAALEGKDVSDHLSAGHGLDALVPLTVADLGAVTEERTNGEAHTVPEQPESASAEEDRGAPLLRFLSGREFRKQPLAKIEPLFGTENDALMMPGSLMLLAGIGGSGKTTLALHAVAHWAAGLPWFGIETRRALRVVVIENEGPHDPFARKVDDFAERFVNCTCSGEPHGTAKGLDENCVFLDAPWGKFTFDDHDCSEQLRDAVLMFQADLVVANPLGRLGMKGAGAPEETRAFLNLLVHAGLGEHFAALLVHHLAKANPATPLVQQISGDWGPHPDTILVMEQAGERRSKLSFGKVRWGDQGRSPMILDWLTDPDGPIGYSVQKKDEINDELVAALSDRVHKFLETQAEPVSMSAIRGAIRGKNEFIQRLVLEGVDSGLYQCSGGPRSKYWLTEQENLGV